MARNRCVAVLNALEATRKTNLGIDFNMRASPFWY
jgi:hypothetical protein